MKGMVSEDEVRHGWIEVRPGMRVRVVVYIGPRCHFVQYPLRGGEMFNQVAVFESAKARAGQEDWGTPDELDAAFEGTCGNVRQGIPMMWRDRWWRMFDRDPVSTWVYGRIAPLGDAAHPPLQYMAQGAVMAIEDGWVLAQHVSRLRTPMPDGAGWDAALAAYQAVRPEHCRRVVLTARTWASYGTSTEPDGSSATRSCAPATPTTTASPTGSTARPR
jgi:3-hydroxybenzoate 6-monooxygenase